MVISFSPHASVCSCCAWGVGEESFAWTSFSPSPLPNQSSVIWRCAVSVGGARRRQATVTEPVSRAPETHAAWAPGPGPTPTSRDRHRTMLAVAQPARRRVGRHPDRRPRPATSSIALHGLAHLQALPVRGLARDQVVRAPHPGARAAYAPPAPTGRCGRVGVGRRIGSDAQHSSPARLSRASAAMTLTVLVSGGRPRLPPMRFEEAAASGSRTRRAVRVPATW